MPKKVDVAKYKETYLKFLKGCHTAVLCFTDKEGKPFSSIAPFVQKGGKFYIYISQVADHYELMKNSKVVDVLMLADQAKTKNPFATERVRFSCVPTYLGNDASEDIFELFNELSTKQMMDVFRGLDFSLFELNPVKGRYVVGFGLAFDLTIDGSTFTHVVVDKDKKPQTL